MDRLEQILYDYRNSKVNESDINRYLSFLAFEEDKQYYQNCQKVKQKIFLHNISPEDQYFENLRYKSIAATLGTLIDKKIINYDEYQILCKWCLDMKTQVEIAKELGTYQRKISRIIENIQQKCLKYLKNYTIYGDEITELFHSLLFKVITPAPKRRNREGDSPKHKLAYPCEFLTNVSIDGSWYKGRYRPKNQCRIPEYFQATFKDTETKCSLCINEYEENTCSRKEVN